MTPTIPMLARAPAETLNVDALLVLVSIGVLAVVAIAVTVVTVMARRRQHARAEAVLGVAILWAIASAAVVVWSANQSWTASSERERLIESGDVDPRETPSDPGQPWPEWIGIAGVYGAIAAWAGLGAKDKRAV